MFLTAWASWGDLKAAFVFILCAGLVDKAAVSLQKVQAVRGMGAGLNELRN